MKISRAEAIAGLEDGVAEEDSDKKTALAVATAERVELDGRRAFFRLRSKWSWAIIGWITGLIWFNCYLAYKIGSAQWNFSEYQWFITAVTVETFLQIVGIGYIAVKFLFSKG